MMTRIGSLVLLLGLASGLIFAARQSAGPVNAEWARTHDAALRKIMRLRSDARLDFRTARVDPSNPNYYLAEFDAVQGVTRYQLEEFRVSRDAQRVAFKERDGSYRLEYDLADPFRAFRDQIQLAGAPSRGPAEAPLTVVEYLDYTCGYCHLFYQTEEKAMLQRYGANVRLVIKHLPILSSASAQAAYAAVCAHQQSEDKFWALHDKFFENGNQVKQGRAGILALAGQVGLNATAMGRCMDDPATHEIVSRDLQEAQKLGLEATPGFFVNGTPLTGYLRPESFFAFLDEELRAAQSR
ncbi:MAG TPA: thioredoxin domain-containing protein [Candidatus Xenobia bacterium]|nr:thioredoxin domain-containing protein [Candidatus Xenobia bacterium]